MPSTLTLDRADPGIDEMVSAWKNGGRYKVELEIVQTASDPAAATFDVAGVTEGGEAMPYEGEEGMPPEEEGMMSMRKRTKPTIVIAIGKAGGPK